MNVLILFLPQENVRVKCTESKTCRGALSFDNRGAAGGWRTDTEATGEAADGIA